MAKALYICYFGLKQPLVQTQVLPYLRELLKDGHEISLLTFEPSGGEAEKGRQGDEEIRAELAAEGIEWHCLGYHKWPSAPATAYDILRGTLFVAKLLRREKFDVLHGRVHIPTLMGAIARKFSRRKPKLLFDIRGFFPEEYTDAGVWPENGVLYRAAKKIEKWLMKEADGFVVLTEKAREILFGDEGGGMRDEGSQKSEIRNPKSKNPVATAPGSDSLGRPVEVIPCCVDMDRFAASDDVARVRMRKKLGVETRKVIAYVGSFGGWYMTDEMIDFFSAAREHDTEAFVLVLTQRDKEMVAERMRERGFAEGEFHVGSVAPAEIPHYLSAADIALSFIKACYSKQSSSPTKIAEYLACGVPIIANRGVGDVDELIEKNRVGVLIDNFSKASYRKALKEIEELGDVREKCRETAIKEFDLANVGGSRYRRLYKRILD